MLNKKERMAKLNDAGVEVGKYFTFEIPEGLEPGTKIHLVVDESGVTKVAPTMENDAILDQIIEDGYVRNTKLHRRFVMAQMFHMLNYVSYDGYDRGYNDCLRRMYGYDYTIKMMLEEVRVLGQLEERDRETFKEREHFFDRGTIAAVLEDYIKELKKYVETLPIHKCKGVPYKRVKGVNIFVEDFDKKLYMPIKHYITQVMCVKDYKTVYNVLCNFKRNMVKLPYNTPKSKAWIDAFKGAGSYYTLKNLVMFHNCNIISVEGINYGVNSMVYLKSRLDAYKGEYYKMFALMKQVIADNNINTKTHIREVCNK